MTGWWRDFGAARSGRPAAPRPIVRPALLARLDQVLDKGQVVLVVAGPGAGKSTLLAQWADACDAAVVQAGDLRIRRDGVPLVIDGLERLTVGGDGWRQVTDLVGVVPLILSGRDEIPVPGVDRLGAAELAFAEDETYQVLAAALADAAAADGLAPDLHLLTGGWPALVGLAAAWLARLPAADRPAGVQQLSRVDGALQEHLTGVLVAVLHPDEQELVRRLVHLPVDAAVADALDLTEDLTGDLAGVPPLVQPVIGRAGWYAVPQPLRDTIRRRLPLPEPERQALVRAYEGM